MALKYIVTEDDFAKEYLYIFPNYITHNEFASKIRQKVISAGFVQFRVNEDGVVVPRFYGESLSLDIKSNPEKDLKVYNLNRYY